MQSAIGQNLQASRVRSVAVGIALMTVAVDFLIVMARIDPQNRIALAILAFAIIVYLTDGDLESVGLQARPAQGWSPWVRWSYLIALMVGACLAIGFGLWRLSGRPLPLHTTPPQVFWPYLLQMCFVAPMLEETIYRLVVCVAFAPVIGCWPTIILNGCLFGALHVVYGSASPENLVGGFFLAWAYLKSGTILVPLLLHSAGNFLALGAQVAGWHLIN